MPKANEDPYHVHTGRNPSYEGLRHLDAALSSPRRLPKSLRSMRHPHIFGQIKARIATRNEAKLAQRREK